jgi:hypothetical protein
MITYGTGTYAGVLTVITGDISEVQGIVQAGMTAQGYTAARATNLDNLDAAISTRNTVTPDNAGVAAIKAKTDNLPNDPAGVSNLPNVSGLATSAQAVTINEGVKLASLGIPHDGDVS